MSSTHRASFFRCCTSMLSGCMLIAILAGCGASKIPGALSLSRSRILEGESKASVIALAEQRREEVTSARYLFEALLIQGSNKQQLKQAFVFDRPDKLRAEFFLPGLNQTNLLVVTREDAIEALNVADRIYYSGVLSLENFQRMLSIPALPEELMLWISGRVPFDASEARQSRISKFGTTGNFILDYTLHDGRAAQIELSPQGLVLRLDIRNRAGGTRILISRLEYEPTGLDLSGAPQKILFWIPNRSLSGELQQLSAALNPDLSAAQSLFTVHVPNAFEKRALD